MDHVLDLAAVRCKGASLDQTCFMAMCLCGFSRAIHSVETDENQDSRNEHSRYDSSLREPAARPSRQWLSIGGQILPLDLSH